MNDLVDSFDLIRACDTQWVVRCFLLYFQMAFDYDVSIKIPGFCAPHLDSCMRSTFFLLSSVQRLSVSNLPQFAKFEIFVSIIIIIDMKRIASHK